MQPMSSQMYIQLCIRCGARSHLIRIFPLTDGHDAWSYECRNCGRIDRYDVSPEDVFEETHDEMGHSSLLPA